MFIILAILGLSALILVVITFTYTIMAHRFTMGKTIGLTAQAQRLIQLDQFNQSHPAAKRQFERYQHWFLMLKITFSIAIIVPSFWLLLLPNYGTTTGMLIFLAVLAFAMAIVSYFSLTSQYQIRQTYRQHKLLLQAKSHLLQWFVAFEIAIIVFTYESLAFDAYCAIYWF